MICKECGAYNPDHANFCKVCAANLKGQDAPAPQEPETDAAPQEQEAAPAPSRMNRTVRQKPAASAEPEAAPEETEKEAAAPAKTLEPEENTTRFSRKRRPVIVEEEDDEDEYDEEDDEDEDDEEEEKPRRKGFLFGRSRKKKDEEDEDDEEEEDEDDSSDDDEEYDEDDEDEDDEDEEYEEYEPTPPRGRKSANGGKKKPGGVNVVAILLGGVALILVLMACIVIYCNKVGGDLKGRLPSFLQFNCQGKEQPNQGQDQQTQDANNQQQNDGSVTGGEIDFNATSVEEGLNAAGQECFKIYVYLQPGETVQLDLPNQDPSQSTNTDPEKIIHLALEVPKVCFYPNTPVEDTTYTFTPELYVISADGTKTRREVQSLTLTLPKINLNVTVPENIPAEGIMAAEGNVLHIEGTVDDHTVTVYANDQQLNVYNEGVFQGDYKLSGDAAETVVIKASKDNYASSEYTFTLNPYVFVPEAMTLTVNGDKSIIRAGTANQVSVSGTVSPGSTVTASCDDGDVACGAVTVNADGTYSFEATFNGYGFYKINLHASQEGYEEKDLSCYVARFFDSKDAMVKAYNKTKSYHEIYKYSFDKVMADPNDKGAYRFTGKVVSVEQVDGLEVVCVEAMTAKGKTTNIYCVNMSEKWTPSENVGKSYKIYCTLNGLYSDGTSLYTAAWFAMINK